MIQTILLVDSSSEHTLPLKQVLESTGYRVLYADNGNSALALWKSNTIDIVITDILLKGLDGVEFIRQMCANATIVPYIMIYTAIHQDQVRSLMHQFRVARYIKKPSVTSEILRLLSIDKPKFVKRQYQSIQKNLTDNSEVAKIQSSRIRIRTSASTSQDSRLTTPTHSSAEIQTINSQNLFNEQSNRESQSEVASIPPQAIHRDPQRVSTKVFGIGISVSTGGPSVLEELFSELPFINNAVIFVVIHGPSWMIESLTNRLNAKSLFPIQVATDGMEYTAGNVYFAPGDSHLILRDSRRMQLLDTEKINFVRPSSDPLLSSIATVFKTRSVGIQLTGLGHDGMDGCKAIYNEKGKVYVQDPTTASAPPMPKSVIESGIDCEVLNVSQISKHLVRYCMFADSLAKNR
jgi:chemotaxis response regulator CheB